MRDVLEKLLREHASEVSLDAIGDAIGSRAVDVEQIDRLLEDLEREGRKIVAPSGGTGVASLKKVVVAARAIGGESGRTAKIAEIAARTGLSEPDVRQALLLARVMGR